MAVCKRHILAIGGLLSGDDNRPLLQYLLSLAGKPCPAIGIISAATGDALGTLQRFDAMFAFLDCRLSHLRFFDRTPDLREFVAAQDVILVGGGNTKSMLGVWRGARHTLVEGANLRVGRPSRSDVPVHFHNVSTPNLPVRPRRSAYVVQTMSCALIAPAGKVGAWTVRSGGTAKEGGIVEEPLTAQRIGL